jgi:hypothetical protein
MSPATGRCLCGTVRFTVESVEPHFHACHCGMCRRWAGGPVFAASVEGLTLEGSEHVATYASSEWAERGFCRVCGSNLYYHLKPADRYLVSVGCFDDATRFALAGEIFVDNKPAGYALAGDHERLTEAETLARFAAAQG